MNFWNLDIDQPQNIAIIEANGHTHTYADLLELVRAQEKTLNAIGIRTLGFILCDNRLADITLYLACIRQGHVPLLLAAQMPSEQLKALQAIYQPQWISMDGKPNAQQIHTPAQLHPDLSLLLSTSGTTGSPRLVRLTRTALQANATSIASYLELRAQERAITSLPMHYSYGLSVINSHLLTGSSLVLNTDSVLSREFLVRLREQRVTSLAGVPYIYQMLQRTGFFKLDLPHLQTLTQAGGPLDEKLTRTVTEHAQTRGRRFFVMYGQTEACARISYVPPNKLGGKIGSIGIPIPGGSLEINAGSSELIYRGPNVMLGYADQRADLSRGDDNLGRLATGDLGYVDEDGFFYITGRIRRFIKVSGNRISLDQVEQALQTLLQMPVAVGGSDDKLVVWIQSQDTSMLEQARNHVRQQYSIHHSMVQLKLVEQIPLFPTGKKDYNALTQTKFIKSDALDCTQPTLQLDTTQPYGFRADTKEPAFLDALNGLTMWHQQRCSSYANMIERIFHTGSNATMLAEVPYLPVRLFKTLELRSAPETQIIKTLTSSGTTGQTTSKIYLDRETSMRQTRALSSIMASFLGKKRWPMVIIDSADLLKNRRQFNARAAGILGFSTFGRDHHYCLNDALDLDVSALQAWLDRHAETPVLLFGFTFLVWQGFYQSALRQNVQLRFPAGSLLIHGGGWKRLQDQQVSNDEYKERLQQQFGIKRIYNYYGMVEQVGSIFMECEHGHLHSPSNADVIIRDPQTLQPIGTGHPGIIQVLSTIPLSYPGHSLLTEDMGTLHGKDDCPCGRAGSYFTVSGRLPQVEMRGCSDTRVMP